MFGFYFIFNRVFVSVIVIVNNSFRVFVSVTKTSFLVSLWLMHCYWPGLLTFIDHWTRVLCST